MFRFAKFPPTTYVLLYKNGLVVREGPGLSFWHYAPTSTLVAVPIVSIDMPFIFEEVSADYQTLTIQGQVTYRIAEPKKIAGLLNYSLDAYSKRFVSNDPDKLSQRVSNVVNVLTRRELGVLPMKEAMKSTELLVKNVSEGLKSSPETQALGLEILGLAILAVKPAPETARALEAQTREKILQEADEALFARRNSAVDLERSIKENELKTQISVEEKNLEIRQAELNKDRVVQERKQAMRDAENLFLITQEQRRSELVKLASANAREEADARAYGMQAMVNAVSNVDPRILQSLAVSGMKPQQLIALAFQGLAEKAEKIGNLNITPELLSGLMDGGAPATAAKPTR
jgi:hypothetical protein